MAEWLSGGLVALNMMLTEPLCTATSLEVGRLALSSGRAELKFHSSSAEEPLVC